MKVTKTHIPDILLIEPKIFEDSRGVFYESYNYNSLKQYNLEYNFIQDNHSKSIYGVLRGLHYQKPPYAQTKLVRVTKGRVLDIAVDLRIGSPTFLQHITVELSDENNIQMLIPQGFAHGFVVLSKEVEFLYKCDNYYNKDAEGGIIYNDKTLNIDWKIDAKDLLLSAKDALNPKLENADFNFPFHQYTNS
jgi:dTDP-4-dehydrorhamnose 3,5-epimerase